MANIFDGIKNITKEDLAHEVAILEVLNSKNLTKITMQRMGQHILNASSNLAKYIKKKNNEDIEKTIKEIPVLIRDAEKDIVYLPMKYILKRYISMIIEISDFSLKHTDRESLYENLSVKVINEAAALFNIPVNFTPGMKADTIFIKYTDNMIRLLNHNEKLAVYNKRISRELLAREVMILVKSNQGTLTPKFKNMPSYEKNPFVREENLKSYNDYCTKYRLLKDYEEELTGDEIILKKYRDHDEMIRVKFDKEREIIERYKNELEGLKTKKVQLELEKAYKGNEFSECLQHLKYYKDNSDYSLIEKKDRLKEDIVFINANLNKIISEYNYKMNYIQEFKRKINNLTDDDMIYEGSKIETRYNDLKIEYDRLKLEVDGMYSYRKRELINKWETFFPSVAFTDEAVKEALFLNPTNDLLYFERTITELIGYFDKTAVSSGMKNDNYYIKTNFNGKEKTVYYSIEKYKVKNLKVVGIE